MPLLFSYVFVTSFIQSCHQNGVLLESRCCSTTEVIPCKLLLQRSKLMTGGRITNDHAYHARSLCCLSLQDSSSSNSFDDCEASDKAFIHQDDLVIDDDAIIRQETTRWIETVVLGMNLCPFAFKPVRDGKLAIHVFHSQQQQQQQQQEFHDLSEFVLQEMSYLDDAEDGDTSIIVVPALYPDNFRSYLSYIAKLKSIRRRRRTVQIAPFHPYYVFADMEGGAARNLIQRSPYPMIHLLREEDLDAAVDVLHGDTSKVWQRNADLMDYLELKLGSVENVERAINKREGTSMEDDYLSFISIKDVPKVN